MVLGGVKTFICSTAALAFTLAACGEATKPDSPAEPIAAAPAPTPSPTATPTLTPEAERGVKGARNVLLAFARAIELRRFREAWAMLSEADRGKWPEPEFARMFVNLGKITVAVPNGTMEGAAGSSYYEASVTITANDKDGRPVRIEGKAVLRRVNDVDGASPEQLRWHFESLSLDWTH